MTKYLKCPALTRSLQGQVYAMGGFVNMKKRATKSVEVLDINKRYNPLRVCGFRDAFHNC